MSDGITGKLNRGREILVVASTVSKDAETAEHLHLAVEVVIHPGDIVVNTAPHRGVEAEPAGVYSIARGQIVSMGIAAGDKGLQGNVGADAQRVQALCQNLLIRERSDTRRRGSALRCATRPVVYVADVPRAIAIQRNDG